jgi:hypothetical protein
MTPAPRTPLKPFIGWVVVAHLPALLYTGYGMAVPVYRLKREAMADRNHLSDRVVRVQIAEVANAR